MSRKPRTPLSQGILTTTDRLYESCHSVNERNITPPPAANITNESDDSNGTPRTITPKKTATASHPKSINELSLSDVEINSNHQRRRPVVTSEVLVVESDCSDINKSGEVQTRSFRIESPIKVIRHSPSTSPTNVSSNNSKSMTDTVTNKKDSSLGGHKKKKKVYVQSRYKQQPVKKEDKQHQSINISAIIPSNKNSSSSKKKSSRVTSTPFLITSMYEKQAPSYDGSILDQTNEPTIKEPIVKKNNRLKKDVLPKKDTSKEGNKEYKATTAMTSSIIDNDELLLDLHYARLLQCAYLDMKIRQTFTKQEEKTKREIYNLWASNRKLEKEIEALKLSVNTRQIEIAVDQLMSCQINNSKPLNKLIIKSARLHESLSNTSHFLPVSNIKLSDESTFLTSLDESKHLLADITTLTRNDTLKVEDISSTADVLMKSVQAELTENLKCYSLLQESNSLVNHERSLQVQMMQQQQRPSLDTIT